MYVNKSNLKIEIVDMDDVILNQDELGFHWEENYDYGGNIVKMSKVCHSGESYYGMGDKASHTNLKGKRVNNVFSIVYTRFLFLNTKLRERQKKT